MKKLIVILIVVGGLGGGGFALYKSGKLPFLGKQKPTHATAQSTSSKDASHANSNTDVHADKAKPPAAHATKPPAEPKQQAARRATPPKSLEQLESEAREKAARIKKLASIYEQMPASQVGEIMKTMKDPLKIELLRRMDEKAASQILAGMKIQDAVRLSEKLASAAP